MYYCLLYTLFIFSTPEKKMDMAVKAVASNFKEDSEKVESELKEKLTALNLAQKDLVAEEVEAMQDIPPFVLIIYYFF